MEKPRIVTLNEHGSPIVVWEAPTVKLTPSGRAHGGESMFTLAGQSGQTPFKVERLEGE